MTDETDCLDICGRQEAENSETDLRRYVHRGVAVFSDEVCWNQNLESRLELKKNGNLIISCVANVVTRDTGTVQIRGRMR